MPSMSRYATQKSPVRFRHTTVIRSIECSSHRQYPRASSSSPRIRPWVPMTCGSWLPHSRVGPVTREAVAMTTNPTLSRSYPLARAAFLAAAHTAGAAVDTFEHPLTGPEGGAEYDVAGLAGRRATVVGRRRPTAWRAIAFGVADPLAQPLRPPTTGRCACRQRSCAQPVRHGVVRRVNEDNVDLNRNFVDCRSCHRTTSSTTASPPTWCQPNGPPRSSSTPEALLALVTEWGFLKVCRRQRWPVRTLPKAPYGGAGPVWSHRYCATVRCHPRPHNASSSSTFTPGWVHSHG